MAELAAEFGFTAADVAARAGHLDDRDEAWLQSHGEERALGERSSEWLRQQIFPWDVRPPDLATHRARLWERAINASVVLETAERDDAVARTGLALEELYQQEDPRQAAAQRRELAWQEIERDLAARFEQRVEAGYPFQLAYSTFYTSEAYAAFHAVKFAEMDELRACEAFARAYQRLQVELRRRLAAIMRKRRRERAVWGAAAAEAVPAKASLEDSGTAARVKEDQGWA
ncbi:MAG: hypothetical protein ACRDHX_16800 [Chloroflexota bacterium]